MVVIDDHSRDPVVEILRSTSARSVIPLFDKIVSLFGIPEELKTDNGPPFQSFEFKQFAEQLGFKHRRITPLWPKANGEAERFMRTLGKVIRTAQIESNTPFNHQPISGRKSPKQKNEDQTTTDEGKEEETD